MASVDVIKECRAARDMAFEKGKEAIETIEGVHPTELVSMGCIESALSNLEEARDELLRINVMIEHNQVIVGSHNKEPLVERRSGIDRRAMFDAVFPD